MNRPKTPDTRRSARFAAGFSLVELLVVIVIISILLTAGAIGIGNLTQGKGVSNGVSNAEAVFDEARTLSIGKGAKTRVLVDINDSQDASTYLKRILVVYQEVDADGKPVTPETWVLSSRGYTLPDQTYFSRTLSKKDQQGGGGQLDEMSLVEGGTIKRQFAGNYLYYEFNSEGICATPGASFIIGSGARPPGQDPRATGSGKRDFGGFVVWRNGRTSAFRGPDQMGITSDLTTF